MLNDIKTVNLFNNYKQKENQFTNGLIALLSLGNIEDPHFVNDFLNALLNLNIRDEYKIFQVLEGYEVKSTADAKLIGNLVSIQFETKIVSAALKEEQIKRHLAAFDDDGKKQQILVLLTPDDSNSKYIKNFLTKNKKVQHLEWKKVYDYLEQYTSNKEGVFKAIVEQYLLSIKDTIFEQDIVGIIQKIAFGDESEVYPDKYLDEMKQGKWTRWNTPREYKNLNGTGRKLLLYDKNRKSITVEVEIAEVQKTNEELKYPWTNFFVCETLTVMEHPIRLDNIEQIDVFKNFASERAPYRNLTYEQYKQLMKFKD